MFPYVMSYKFTKHNKLLLLNKDASFIDIASHYDIFITFIVKQEFSFKRVLQSFEIARCRWCQI